MVWRRRPRSARIVQNPAKADPRCLQGDLRSMYVHERRHSHQPGSRFPGCHHFPVCAAGTSIGPYLTIGCSASAQVVLTVPTVSQRTFRERLHPTTSWARERVQPHLHHNIEQRGTDAAIDCVCAVRLHGFCRGVAPGLRRFAKANIMHESMRRSMHARTWAHCAVLCDTAMPIVYRLSAAATSSSTYCTCPCAK